jgi:GH24 family phage-related lysozyme (muramidase)
MSSINEQRHINEKGLALVKEFEGCQLEAYLCPAGVWTIGYGHTLSAVPGMLIDETKAEALLREDLRKAEEAVERLVKVPINDNQFSALVSFVFNIGASVGLGGEPGAFDRSTLLKMLNAGEEAETVVAQFLRWNKAGDEELPGLTRRRHAERALFLEPLAS